MKLFNPKLKETPVLLFSRETLRAFHHCYFRCFHFNINSYYCFWVFLFLIAFVHFTVSSGVFITPLIWLFFFECFHFTNLFTVTIFWQALCFFVVEPRVLRIKKIFFYSQVFFTSHSFSIFGTVTFYPGFPRGDSSVLKAVGLPLNLKTQTRSICLFESHNVQEKVLVCNVLRPYWTLYQPLPGFEPTI